MYKNARESREPAKQLPEPQELAVDAFYAWQDHKLAFLKDISKKDIFMGNLLVSYTCIKLLYYMYLPLLKQLFPNPRAVSSRYAYEDHENIIQFLQDLRRSLFLRRKERTGRDPWEVILREAMQGKPYRPRQNPSYIGPHLGIFQLQVTKTASCLDKQLLVLMESKVENILQRGLSIQSRQGIDASHFAICGTTFDFRTPRDGYVKYISRATIHHPEDFYDVITSGMLFRVKQYRNFLYRYYDFSENEYTESLDTFVDLIREATSSKVGKAVQNNRSMRVLSRSGKTRPRE